MAFTPTSTLLSGCALSAFCLMYCKNCVGDQPRCSLSFAYLPKDAGVCSGGLRRGCRGCARRGGAASRVGV